MLGSVQLGVYQLGQGFAAGVIEPPVPVEVEPDLVAWTARIRTVVDASAHVRRHVSLTAGVGSSIRVAPVRVRSRVGLTAGVVSVVHLRVER